jgi:hypothetical protein
MRKQYLTLGGAVSLLISLIAFYFVAMAALLFVAVKIVRLAWG